MSVVLLKIVHVATIALWSAGLLVLPFVYRQRRGLSGEALHRLHAFTRYLYVAIVSPAAFVAIASGTVLIFTQATYVPWFSAKLVLVAVMTGIHIFSGLMILKLFEPGGFYPAWRFVLVTGLTLSTVGGILVLVLAKPAFGRIEAVEELFEPGALARLVEPLIAWTR